MTEYAKQGRSCYPVTPALTDNRKFLPLDTPVYFQPYTYMLQYPGYSGDFVTNVRDTKNPEEIKAFNIKSKN